jgi:hypothetical protein
MARLFTTKPGDPDGSRRAQRAWLKELIALELESAKVVATQEDGASWGDCFRVAKLATKATRLLRTKSGEPVHCGVDAATAEEKAEHIASLLDDIARAIVIEDRDQVVFETECRGFVKDVSEDTVFIEFDVGNETEDRSFGAHQFPPGVRLQKYDMVTVRSRMCLVPVDPDTKLTEEELRRSRDEYETEKRLRESAKREGD